jgi:hypothetical protein
MPATVEQRVSTLEEVLATYITETRADQARRTREMSEFREEMRKFREETRADQESRTREMSEFKEEMRKFREETRADQESRTREIGEFKEEMRKFREETRADQESRTREMSEFKQEMLDFQDETRADRDFRTREMQTFQDEVQADQELRAREMHAFKSEMQAFREEMREDRKAMNRKWGELANRLGTIVEDVVAPNVPGFMSRYFHAGEPDFFALRVRKRHPGDPSRRREFDVIAVSGDQLFFVEAKATVRREYLTSFAADYREVLEYFPEYQDFRLTPVFSSFYLKPEEIEFLSGHGIYALMMSDESMDLANFEGVRRN